jgi:hypothetical protein
VTTLTWDDQLRRCVDGSGKIVTCSLGAAVGFAAETATGDYRLSHAFSDGQVHTQSVSDARPAWAVSGIADFDALGRTTRSFKIRFLPRDCPGAGTW